MYRAGRDNVNADTLSRNPVTTSAPESELVTEVHIASIEGIECEDLLRTDPDSEAVI